MCVCDICMLRCVCVYVRYQPSSINATAVTSGWVIDSFIAFVRFLMTHFLMCIRMRIELRGHIVLVQQQGSKNYFCAGDGAGWVWHRMFRLLISLSGCQDICFSCNFNEILKLFQTTRMIHCHSAVWAQTYWFHIQFGGKMKTFLRRTEKKINK